METTLSANTYGREATFVRTSSPTRPHEFQVKKARFLQHVRALALRNLAFLGTSSLIAGLILATGAQTLTAAAIAALPILLGCRALHRAAAEASPSGNPSIPASRPSTAL